MFTRTRVFFFSLLLAAGSMAMAPFAYAADDVTIGGPWYKFHFDAPGATATGCKPADPTGGSCDGIPPDAAPAPTPPWTITVPAGGANLSVTDIDFAIDQFEVYDNSVLIGTTSVPGGVNIFCGNDPATCFTTPGMSTGVFKLAEGQHSIKIIALAGPGNETNQGGMGYFRLDPATGDHFVCYMVTNEAGVNQNLLMSNQFGAQVLQIGKAVLVCVPSTKLVLQPPSPGVESSTDKRDKSKK